MSDRNDDFGCVFPCAAIAIGAWCFGYLGMEWWQAAIGGVVVGALLPWLFLGLGVVGIGAAFTVAAMADMVEKFWKRGC